MILLLSSLLVIFINVTKSYHKLAKQQDHLNYPYLDVLYFQFLFIDSLYKYQFVPLPSEGFSR